MIAVVLAATAHAQGFDNDSVKALHRAGLGDAAIIAKIHSLPCSYDVSTDGLIALKRAGLSDAIIATMVERCDASTRAQGADTNLADPTAKHAPGIYVLQDWLSPARLQPLRPSKASGLRISGNGSILLPYIAKLVLPDTASHTPVKSGTPSFFFYFDMADRRVNDFGSAASGAAQSPDEFTLVRFKVKGAQREVGMGKVSLYDTRRGVDTKSAVSFSSQEIGDGIFKVAFAEKLPVGEYAFVLTGANGASRIYDFSLGS